MKPTEEVKERSCETEFTRRISEAARPTGKGAKAVSPRLRGERVQQLDQEGEERCCETDRFSSLPSSIYLVQEGKKDQIKNE